MADGLTTQTTVATIPDATTIATDDAGAAGHVQMVKLAIATDGSATALTADNTDGLLVNLGTNNDVTVAGVATAANQTTGNTSLATIAGAVAGTEMQVDVLSMPTTTVSATNLDIRDLTQASDSVAIGDGTDTVDVLADGADNVANTTNQLVTAAILYAFDGTAFDRVTIGGGTEATALRVTLASDSTGVVSVDDNGASLTVDNTVLSVVGGGTEATAQRVTIASDSTGVLSVDDNGASLTVDNSTLAVVGGGTEATAMRVTIASDSTGVVSVDDNGGALTVDGSLTTVSTVTTVTTLTGSSLAHSDPDGSTNPHKIGAKAVASTEGVTLVTANDRTDLYADVDGVLVVKQSCTNDDVVSERVSNTDGASTAFTNFAAVASTHNCVSAISLFNSSGTAGYVDFRDGTAGSILWTMALPAGGGSIISCGNQPYLFRTSQNTALAFDVSAALSTVYISVSGYQSKA